MKYKLNMLLLLLCAAMIACRTHKAAEDQQFKTLFEGFQLISVGSLPEGTPVQEIDSSTLRNTQPLERVLTSGHAYVFRKTTEISNEQLGMKVLPERLAKIGAQVTKAPHSSQDFMYPMIGGPLFLIEFQKDGHRGTMFNRFRAEKDDHWEELIVAYK
jgi:hypothetical protein